MDSGTPVPHLCWEAVMARCVWTVRVVVAGGCGSWGMSGVQGRVHCILPGAPSHPTPPVACEGGAGVGWRRVEAGWTDVQRARPAWPCCDAARLVATGCTSEPEPSFC